MLVKLHKNKGITLIALIITIIVLLILAGVAVNMLVGEDGILSHTQTSTNKYSIEAEKEALKLEILNIQTEILKTAGRKATLEDLQERIDLAKYEIEMHYEPIATSTPVANPATYVIVKRIGTNYYFTVDDKLIITKVEEISEENSPISKFTIKLSDTTYSSTTVTLNETPTSEAGTIEKYDYVAETADDKIELTNITETTKTITGLTDLTTYKVYVIAYDNAGNKRKSEVVTVETTAIPIKNLIGQPVNYSANGITDWKVFYGYDNGEIYLIKSDYLNKSKIPSSAMMTEGSNQRAYWPTSVTYDNIIDTDTSIRTRFLMSYNKSTTNVSIKCVSKLLNTTTWSAFANGTSGATQITGGFAIGSPTLEMWVASWNEVHTTEKITVSKNNYGFSVSNKNPTGVTSDLLYNTSNHVQINALNGYWIASSDSSSIGRYMIAYNWQSGTTARIGSADATNASHTARPVVSIPATYKLQWNSTTNKYDIVEK